MDLIFRIATEFDAAELNRLNTLFNGASFINNESVARSLRDNAQEQVFVAADVAGLVGFCCVQLLKSFCYSRCYAEITELFVEESYRRKNIATRLMNCAENHNAGLNIGGFQLFTGGDNAIAQQFYESLGYTKTDERMYRKRNQG